MPKQLSYLLALALSAGVLAACGSDDDDDTDRADTKATPTAAATTGAEPSTTSTGEAPTKAEYIASADKICAQSRQDGNEIVEQTFQGQEGQPTAEQYQEVAAKLAPLANETGEKLLALPRPEGDEQELQAYFDTGFKAIEPIEAAAKSPAAAEKLFKSPAANENDEEADRLARAYGFRQCGKDD